MKKLNISQSFKIFTNIMLASFMLFLVIVLASSCNAQNKQTTTYQTIENEDFRGFFDQSCVMKIDSVMVRHGRYEYYEYYMVYNDPDAYECAILIWIGTEAIDNFFAKVGNMENDYQIMHRECGDHVLVYDPNYYED